MEIKDFVSTTLTQIAEGILESQRHASLHGYTVSPKPTGVQEQADKTLAPGIPGSSFRFVDFDIAVTSNSSQEAGAGANLHIASFRMGGNNTENSVSRVRFSVLVKWPIME